MIGREQELAAACAVLDGGMHLLLEGPVGSGKTTLAAEACRRLGRQTIRIDGDDRFTESRLAGWFDPPLVLRLGYGEDAFVPGPLVLAMREGRVLFLNELNRLPEAAQNLLLPALDEGVVQVPHLGRGAGGRRVPGGRDPESGGVRGDGPPLRGAARPLRAPGGGLPDGGGGRGDRGRRDGVRGCGRWCAQPSASCGPREYTRACAAAHPCAARWRSWTWPARRDGALSGRVRAAAETALATRVELRDGDAELGDLLDELVELVVERGEDPDVGAAAWWGVRADDRRAQGAAARDRDERRGAEERGGARPQEPLVCTLEDRRALAEQLRAAPEDLDGWQLAGDLSAGALSYAGERAYLCAQHLAASAVLQRAVRLVGPLKAATRSVREPMLEPWGGELDVEATVENLLGKPHPEPGDLIVQRRVDRRHQVVLMVDTSLSMAGEKMALAAVAAAVLALKLRPGDLAVVLFADGARTVLRFGEEIEPAELVRRMLAVPCGGGTDIAAALRLGHAELQRGRDPGRCGLLVSDGVYTCGADPLPAAARFGELHVLLMEERERRDPDVPVTTWISPRLAVGEAIARRRTAAWCGWTASPRSRAACSRWRIVS